MAYFLHMERKIDGIISKQESMVFESILSRSDLDEKDFIFSEDGSEIGLCHVGTYVIQWYVSQMTGLATTGQVFQLQQKDASGNWVYLGDGTSHLKVSASSGFGILDVTEEFLQQSEDSTAWFRLQNLADQSATLCSRNSVKAALVAYSINEKTFQGDAIHVGMNWDLSDEEWEPTTIGKVVPNGALLPFDRVLSDSYFGGMGLIDSGLFKITAPGKYKVEWELPINTLDYAADGLIGLYIGDEPYVYSQLPMARGNASGIAIFDLWFDEEIDIHLTNLSGCNLRLARHSHLTITYLCPPSGRR